MKKLLLSTIFSLAAFTLFAEPFQVDFYNSEIAVNHPEEIAVNVSTGPGVRYNSYYQYSWIMNHNGKSYIDITFTNNIPKYEKVAKLEFIHLSSRVGLENYSPITVVLNGTHILKKYSPASYGYQSDSFEITEFIKTGENKLRISFDNDALSNYWIQKLEVNFY